MDGSGSAAVFPHTRTPEDVFTDFRVCRAGILKALTTADVEKCYKLCDLVPPELPEPALGKNFARDGMAEKDWLSLVAVHSDSWLIAVAFYFGARFGFDKDASGFGWESARMMVDAQQVFGVVLLLPRTARMLSIGKIGHSHILIAPLYDGRPAEGRTCHDMDHYASKAKNILAPCTQAAHVVDTYSSSFWERRR